jgi:hypothetical protein
MQEVLLPLCNITRETEEAIPKGFSAPLRVDYRD